MARLPNIQRAHKICVICEGNEDFLYFDKLTKIAVWDKAYEFCLFNAKSASNIPAMYTDKFQNNNYEAVLIFCDTDKYPYREYALIKKKIREFHGEKTAAPGKIIIFANPCTMQIPRSIHSVGCSLWYSGFYINYFLYRSHPASVSMNKSLYISENTW